MDDTRETIQWLKSIKEKYIHGGDDDYDDKRRQALDEAIRVLGLFANGVTVQRWIPVTERLPKNLTTVLVVFKRHDEIRRMGFGTLQQHGVWYVSNEGMPPVTHWMPLPEPPKEGE